MSTLLFKNLFVFTGEEFLTTSVSVENGKISHVGEVADSTHFDTVVSGNYLLMPGMINLHTHLPMSLFRGMAEDVPLKNWLFDVIFPLEKEFVSKEMVYLGSMWSMAESLMSGVTTASDMYFFEESVIKAAQKSGMKVMVGEGILDFVSPSGMGPEETLAQTAAWAKKYKNDSNISVAVAPHSPYTVSEKWLLKAAEMSESLDIPYHIHMAETADEVAQFKESHNGRGEFEWFDSRGILSPRFIAAHSVWLEPAEIAIMAKSGLTVALCPSSNMKLSSGFSPVSSMIDAGVSVAVATDGSASNNNLSLIQETELTAKLQKVMNTPTVIPAIEALKMITSIPGKIFGDKRGTITVGAPADLVLIDLSSPELYPAENLAATMVYASSSRDVSRVYINGEEVYSQEKGFSRFNISDLRKESAPLQRSIREFFKSTILKK